MKSMILFLLVFLVIYGGMHLYLLIRVKNAFGMGLAATLIMAAIMVFFIFSPILVRVLEQGGHEGAALAVALAGYTWMGFLFITFSLSIAFDLMRWVSALAGMTPRFLTLYWSAILSLVLGVGLSAWGCYEARNPGVTTLTIETENLPPEIDRFRIVQLSDVHLGLVLREERLKPMLRLVREAEPDLLVSTGDLVDGQMDSIAGSARLFRDIDPPWGKYAVMGNHEFYAGVRLSEDFHEKAGFRLLRGEIAEILNGAMVIAGVDDPAGRMVSPLDGPRAFRDTREEEELLAGVGDGVFRLLLKHQPTVSTALPSPFDLQLSGHTHRGQIVPFNVVTALFYRHSSGFHQLPGGGHLYVSRGAGTWGPAIRLLSPPEVVIIDLVAKN